MRQQHAVGRVVDVDRVHADARQRLESQLPRPHLLELGAELGVVARAVDRPRLHDHDRRAPLAALPRRLVCEVLRPVVGRDEAARRALVRLVDHAAAGVAEDVDRRDVDDPWDAGGPRGVQHVLGAAHVRLEHRRPLRPRDPDLVHGREVEDRVAARHLPLERRRVGEVALDELRVEPARTVGRADERDHLVAALPEPCRHPPAEEARRAGDERPHRYFMRSATSCATSVGVVPTWMPRASSASFFACAVPDEPEMIAPA